MSIKEANNRIVKALNDGEYFIPEKIGIESAAGDWTHDSELDHPWNEYFSGDLKETGHKPTDKRTLKQFVEACEAVGPKGWEK